LLKKAAGEALIKGDFALLRRLAKKNLKNEIPHPSLQSFAIILVSSLNSATQIYSGLLREGGS